MSDYYPPGVSRLPDEEIFPCERCGAKNQHDDYKNCPKCGEHNLCKKCNHCHSCEEDIVPSMKYIECPECNTRNDSFDWDGATQDIFGADSEPILEAITIEHVEEYWYICPTCEEQVDYTRLSIISDED